MKGKLIGALLHIYVITIVGASIVGGKIAIENTCSKTNCNGIETVGKNYQKFLNRVLSTYKHL